MFIEYKLSSNYLSPVYKVIITQLKNNANKYKAFAELII